MFDDLVWIDSSRCFAEIAGLRAAARRLRPSAGDDRHRHRRRDAAFPITKGAKLAKVGRALDRPDHADHADDVIDLTRVSYVR